MFQSNHEQTSINYMSPAGRAFDYSAW